MKRRNFLVAAGLSAVTLGSEAMSGPQQFELNGTSFGSWPHDGRLHCSFAAPSQGWVAVSFNNHRTLNCTRFVIGAIVAAFMHVEEHIAFIPPNPKVQDLGLESALSNVAGDNADAQTTLRISLPHLFSDTSNLTLLPETASNLMLA
jgi:hypothetical protein